MKVLIICSTTFYDKINQIKLQLEEHNHIVKTPNCYDHPVTNQDYNEMNSQEYLDFFRQMYYESKKAIKQVDAVVVLNFDKEKQGIKYSNYIGASTFLEMYEAYMQNKQIYLFNDLPDKNNILLDEIRGFNPILIQQNIMNIVDNQ